MAQTRKQRYDIALNGQGLILARRPELPLITADQDAVFGRRYAQGDRTYDDFARWWFDAQTDWSGGIKEDLSFQDDAKYYLSTNIDAFSEVGLFKLAKAQELFPAGTFDADIACGTYGEVNGTSDSYVGTYDNPGGTPHVYKLLSGGGFSNITTSQMTSNQNVISHLQSRNGILWILTVGNGNTNVVLTYTGSGFTDQGSNIATALGWQFGSSRCGCELGGNYYVACDGGFGVGHRVGIVKTSKTNPSTSTDFAVCVDRATGGFIVDMIGYNGDLYYLVYYGGYAELRVYDPGSSTDSLVYTFIGGNYPFWGVGGKMMFDLNGKLVITVPSNEVWEINNGVLSRIWQTTTRSGYAGELIYLYMGGVLKNNRIHWSDFVYDGENFFNDVRPLNDTFYYYFIPIWVDRGANLIYGYAQDQPRVLHRETSTYRSTLGANYVVFSNFDRVSAIDKIANSVTILFQKLTTGQQITVEYSTDQYNSSMTWTSLGNVSFLADGANVTQKTFYFGDAVVFKKIWLRVKLDINVGGSDLTNTPKVTDVVLSYLPKPDQKMRWQFTVKCIDSLHRKDQTREPKRGIDIRNFLLQSWWTKSVLMFEDFDADAKETLQGPLSSTATTIPVNDSTDNFPERGYLLIDSEYILYNGKQKKSFLNCTRGARGTNKAAHNTNAIVSVAHRVIIDNYKEELVIANDPNLEEYLVTLVVFEV